MGQATEKKPTLELGRQKMKKRNYERFGTETEGECFKD